MGDMIDRDAVLAVIKQQVELWEKGTLVCGLDDLLHLYLPQAIAALPAVTVWVKPDRNTFDAMCAMRNSINEHVPMPSLESDLLQGPENSVFCATVAEAVINEVTRLRSMTNGTRVKRLEWHNFDAWTHWAEGACGTYHVEERNGYWQVELRVGGLVHGVTETGDTTPEDLDAAKAAAQADYAARILAALEPVTQPAPDAAIREAEWQKQQRVSAMRRRHINAPEDPHVAVLCERYGYGAVMDAASRLWARQDSVGAFYIGGCIGLRSDDEAAALLTEKPHDRA